MSSKPKQRPSAQEKVQAQTAMRQYARHSETFRPLEQGAIAELQTADAGKREATLAGRHNADLEGQAVASRAPVMDIGGVHRGSVAARSSAVEQGRSALRTQAGQTARDSIDRDRMNVIKTGRDMSRATSDTLVASARVSNMKAGAKLEAQSLRDQSRANALAEVVTAAGVGTAVASDKALRKEDMNGLQGPPGYEYKDRELNSYQRKLREWFG